MTTAERTAENGTAEVGRNLGDVVGGVLAVLFGAAVLLYVRGFPELPDGQPGPALFPGIIGGLFVVLGAALVVRWFAARRAVPPPSSAGAGIVRSSGGGRLQALAVLGSVVVYLLVVDTLGFVLTMGPLLALLMWLLGARPVVALVGAASMTALMMLLFQRMLLVPLPAGLLG